MKRSVFGVYVGFALSLLLVICVLSGLLLQATRASRGQLAIQESLSERLSSPRASQFGNFLAKARVDLRQSDIVAQTVEAQQKYQFKIEPLFPHDFLAHYSALATQSRPSLYDQFYVIAVDGITTKADNVAFLEKLRTDTNSIFEYIDASYPDSYTDLSIGGIKPIRFELDPLTALFTPNDPGYAQYQTAYFKQMKLDQVISDHDSAQGVLIFIVDSGDFGPIVNHEDLDNSTWTNPNEINNGQDNDHNGFKGDIHGWNFVNNSPDTTDDCHHGPFVRGISTFHTNNGVGMVSPIGGGAKVVTVRFLYANLLGACSGTLVGAVKSIAYCTLITLEEGLPAVINGSFGGPTDDQSLKDAIADAGAHEILFVAAAGNGSANNDDTQNKIKPPDFPAADKLPNIIPVASVDLNDDLSSFSNYGKDTMASSGRGIYGAYADNRYASSSGTSASAPFVTDIVALILQKGVRGLAVKDQIFKGADRVPALAGKVGHGRLNAYNAVNAIATPVDNVIVDSAVFVHVKNKKTGKVIDKLTVTGHSDHAKAILIIDDLTTTDGVPVNGTLHNLSNSSEQIFKKKNIAEPTDPSNPNHHFVHVTSSDGGEATLDITEK